MPSGSESRSGGSREAPQRAKGVTFRGILQWTPRFSSE